MPTSLNTAEKDDPAGQRAQELRETLKTFADKGEGVSFDLRDVDPVEKEAILRVVGLEFDAIVSAHHPSNNSDEIEQVKAEFRRIVMEAEPSPNSDGPDAAKST